MKNKFKVGDRVWDKFDRSPAKITKLTDEGGFEYELDEPKNLGPRMGTQLGGTVFENSLDNWELVGEFGPVDEREMGNPITLEESHEIKRLRECADPTALKLYDAIYEAGIDGGELTSSAIEEFENYKKRRAQISELENRIELDKQLVQILLKENKSLKNELKDRKEPSGESKVTDTHRALARSLEIWVKQDGVSREFIAGQLAELDKHTAAKLEAAEALIVEKDKALKICTEQDDYRPSSCDRSRVACKKALALTPDSMETELVRLRTENTELKEKLENANVALGYHPDSDTDFAAEITHLRDSARSYFHDYTRLLDKVRSIIPPRPFTNYNRAQEDWDAKYSSFKNLIK